jgi:hypothetical protein
MYSLIILHKPLFKTFQIDALLAEYGHSVLHQPSGNPDRNPIELMWDSVRTYVAREKCSFRLDDAIKLSEEEFSAIAKEDWSWRCNSVRQCVCRCSSSMSITEAMYEVHTCIFWNIIIHNLAIKLRTTWLSTDEKKKHERWVLTEEKLDAIGARLEPTPRKSLKRLAQETGLSKPNARRAAQLLKLRPYKTTVTCSRAIQLAGHIFAVGFYSLSSKVRSMRTWHSFLMKRGFTCKDT